MNLAGEDRSASSSSCAILLSFPAMTPASSSGACVPKPRTYGFDRLAAGIDREVLLAVEAKLLTEGAVGIGVDSQSSATCTTHNTFLVVVRGGVALAIDKTSEGDRGSSRSATTSSSRAAQHSHGAVTMQPYQSSEKPEPSNVDDDVACAREEERIIAKRIGGHRVSHKRDGTPTRSMRVRRHYCRWAGWFIVLC
jgi:hypothetical protein